MPPTISDLKSQGHIHLKVVCYCGRSAWIPWAQLPLSDEDTPEHHLGRFKCEGCGSAAKECFGTSQYEGKDTSKMAGWYRGH